MRTRMQKITVCTIVLSLFLWIGCGQNKNQHYQEDIAIETVPYPREERANVDLAPKSLEEPMALLETDIEPSFNNKIEKTEGEPVFNTEEYDHIVENEFKDAKQNPLSTFSIDVDKAAYANVRRFIEMGQMPPKNAVRIEEMINYFPYNYQNPTGEHPFSIQTELAMNPWNTDHLLLKIGIQGKKIDYSETKPSNLVFLIDVSGSMSDKNKLPLLIKSFQLMVNELPSNSKVAIVTYAGNAATVLPSTSVEEKTKINQALEKLTSGGGTAGAQGIHTAYELAEENYIPEGNNRIILATDGDFNIGNSSTGDLVDMIIEKSKKDIYLTICGFGMGNYKDGRMEQITNAGNGNYFYIDNWKESQKVFKKELTANLFTIAKDVKIQIEFNPNTVKSYRLIGYKNRLLNKEDFNDDTKDAGELGAGHNVTALYEIVPKGGKNPSQKVDVLKYQKSQVFSNQEDLVTVKFRYKPIKENRSKLITKTVHAKDVKQFDKATYDLQFASAVASYGMLLRDSKFKGNADYQKVINWAKPAVNNDEYRKDFIELVKMTKDIPGSNKD